MHFVSALLLCAAGAIASKPQHKPRHPAPAVPRTHNNLAVRLRGPANATSREMETVGKRDTYNGRSDDVVPHEYGARRVHGEES
ncbi:hypothetical protein DFH06DRAFT_1182570 [Mycena polygramma]|nr:hypothetical protein DFH06DRAFT_1182570 [Mycena polygramma]